MEHGVVPPDFMAMVDRFAALSVGVVQPLELGRGLGGEIGRDGLNNVVIGDGGRQSHHLHTPAIIGVTAPDPGGEFAVLVDQVPVIQPNQGRSFQCRIAQAIVDNLPASRDVSDVQIAGPGFINFFLNPCAMTGVVKSARSAVVETCGLVKKRL